MNKYAAVFIDFTLPERNALAIDEIRRKKTLDNRGK